MTSARVLAPAKLTWSLEVGERRADGYHDLVAEMLTLDLVDELELTEPGEGIELRAEGEVEAPPSIVLLTNDAASLKLAKEMGLIEVCEDGGGGGGSGWNEEWWMEGRGEERSWEGVCLFLCLSVCVS